MRRVVRLLAPVVLSVLLSGNAAAQRIEGIEVRADAPIDSGQVARVLGLAEGEPLDRGRVRRGIRTLWALGSVDDVRVTTRPSGEGLVVRVDLELRPIVSSVDVSGGSLLWRRRSREWLGLEPGAPFEQSRLERGVDTIRRRLGDRGYRSAAVQPYADYREGTNTVAVTVRIQLGEPDRLTAFRLVGFDDSDRSVAEAVGVEAGDVVTKDLLTRVRRRVRLALVRRGFWQADVLDARQLRGPEGAVVEVSTDPGPRYRLEIGSLSGTEELSRLLQRGIEDERIYPRQTRSVEEHLTRELQAQGFLLAKVEARLTDEAEERVLHVVVDRGPEVRVSSVEFPGARNVTGDRLRQAVRVRSGRVGGWFGQRLDRQVLEDDRRALQSLYRELGFAECTVGSPSIEPTDEAGVGVVFPIEEGLRWRVAELDLSGIPVETLIRLEGKLPLASQGPWNPEDARELHRIAVLALASSGYPDGDVDVAVDTATPGEARVRVTAVPGPFVQIGEVVVGGLTRTAESVVRGPLDEHGVRVGEPYSLEAVLEARRALYELGLFRRVEILLAPGQTGERRTVVVQCEEGRQRSYVFGLGWDTVAGTRLTLGWSHLNLLGHAHAFSAEARISGREVRAQASLREHDLLGLGVPGRLTVYRTEEEFASFSHLSRGLWVDVGDRARQPFRRWFRYEYKIVNPDAPEDILSELERRRRKVRIASIGSTMEWDTRDSRLNPQRGLYLSGSAGLAFPVFRADAHFAEAEGKLSLYGSVLGGTGALGLRVGVTEPLGEPSGERPNLAVPISERYFAGGPVSHRAFAIDELGVPGETIIDGEPIGGNALIIVNLEYGRRLSELFTGVVFVDAGNVWEGPSTVDLGDVRWGVGVGLRVLTPAGPIRLEYGHKLGRREGDSAGELLLAFGVAF